MLTPLCKQMLDSANTNLAATKPSKSSSCNLDFFWVTYILCLRERRYRVGRISKRGVTPPQC